MIGSPVRALRRLAVLAWVGSLAGCGEPAAVASAAVALAAARDREVLVPVEAEITLAGTLSRPHHTSGHVPAVLLVAGSGPQDRDGARVELPGYTPWRDFRDALVTAGFAVLRLDDRGTGASTGAFAGATTDDFARDATAAVGWLRTQPGIDGGRIALVGHSEGAVVALLAARADTAVRALVLLGAPARSGRDIARWQREQLVSSDRARWPAATQRTVLEAADAEAESLATRDPWLRRWFALDPREAAAAVRQPVLLVHGTTDRQVPPEHADELAASLRRAGAAAVHVQRVSDTDHLLLADHDGDPQGYVRLADRRPRAAVIAATTHFLSVHMTPR